MKKLAMFFALLAVSVLVSAIPAFSSSGPFGNIGPSDNTDTGKSVEISQNATVSGTGPYGAFGIFIKEPGGESTRIATSGGSGPYGAFTSFGMITESGAKSVANKKDCIMVANNCPTDR